MYTSRSAEEFTKDCAPPRYTQAYMNMITESLTNHTTHYKRHYKQVKNCSKEHDTYIHTYTHVATGTSHNPTGHKLSEMSETCTNVCVCV